MAQLPNLIRQLTWGTTKMIEGTTEELDKAKSELDKAKSELDKAKSGLDKAKSGLDKAQKQFDNDDNIIVTLEALLVKLENKREIEVERLRSGCNAVECTTVPPAGTFVYVIDPCMRARDVPLINTLDRTGLVPHPLNLDSTGSMQLGIARGVIGSAIRFVANASGPVILMAPSAALQRRADSPAIRESNMMRLGANPAPLYHEGDVLEYRGPTLSAGPLILLTGADFGSPGSSLRLIKSATTGTLPKTSVYTETSTDYTILDYRGFPQKITDIVSQDYRDYVISLVPITGTKVGIDAPLCRVLSWLDGYIQQLNPQERLSDDIPGYDVYLTPQEMLIPIEPQVKSAVKRQ